MPKKLYKNYFMETTFFFGIFLCLLNLGHALRCFDCQNISSPRDCPQITECNTNEQCFTEQILSHDGSLVFNIGCISNTRCSPMIFGKRSLSKRRNEITVCLECCANSFCNHHGCGEKEISLTQRGPYCFNCCDAIIDPKECSNVTVCDKDELCMLTSPVQYANLPQTIYKSQCGSKQMCDVLTHLPSDPRCTSLCCGTDYCNDHCEVPTHVTTVNQHTIQGHITHTSDLTTKGYTTTKAQQFHCNISNNYVHLYTSTVHMCVHFVRHQLNFTDARMACQHEGADLVVLDTYEKSLILRGELARRNIHRSFWIGASGSKASNLFSWVNRSPVDRSEADWGEDLENVCGHVVQDCVAMVKYGHKWTTCNCGRDFYYVCQR